MFKVRLMHFIIIIIIIIIITSIRKLVNISYIGNWFLITFELVYLQTHGHGQRH